MSDPVSPAPAPLQFDHAISADPGETSVSGVVCAHCGKSIVDSYFTVAQKPICAACKTAIEQAVARTRTPGAFAKALVFGLGAAIAGAIVYYAVIALLDLEIGIVAILIGYMVGYAVRKAARGGGGRRYQILAAALTYFAVGMAYMPLAIKGAVQDRTTAADSSRARSAPATATAPDTSTPSLDGNDVKPVAPMSAVRLVGLLLFFTVALPVIIVMGSMPSGIISAAIIAFGIRQAWRMTAAPDLSFVGPLKVAPAAASIPASPA